MFVNELQIQKHYLQTRTVFLKTNHSQVLINLRAGLYILYSKYKSTFYNLTFVYFF